MSRLTRRRPLAGFTLIELLIVIIIIGILVAIGVPAYLQYQAKAKDTDAKSALLVAYKAAVAGDTEVNSSRFPAASTIVNDVQQDEPAASVARGDCYATVETSPVKQVLVDPASTQSQLTMCTRSASGTIWRLSGSLTGTPTVSNGSLVTLAVSGNEITDAVRVASVSWPATQQGGQTDSVTASSSTFVGRPATNLYQYGQDDSAAMVQHGAGGVITTTVDATVPAPFSPESIKVVVDGGAANQEVLPKSAPGRNLPAGTVCAGSFYFKGVAGQSYKTRMTLVNTDTTATEGSITTFTATGGWQLIMPLPLAVAAGEIGDVVREAITVNGTRAETFWIAHPMLESGHSIVAPYVATSGGTTASKSGSRIQIPAALVNPTQSWIAVRIRMGWAASQAGLVGPGVNVPVFWWTNQASGVGSHYLWGYINQTGGNFGSQAENGGPTDGGAATGTPAYNAGDTLTVIFAWDASFMYAAVNGGSLSAGKGARTHGVSTDLSPTIDIGDIGASRWADSNILWVACGTGTLSDADSATINSFGDTDPHVSSFPSSAQTTMVWDGVSSTGSLK